jgi:hypothetical protein
MNPQIVEPTREIEAELNVFLDDRIYEFNIQATGFRDGRPFAGVIRDDETTSIIAAINGHTWGRCCHRVHLWVHESRRGHG